MTTVTKQAMRTHAARYMARVRRTGEEILVTDRKTPFVKIVPARKRLAPDDLFADVRGKFKWKGDINEPTASEWPRT